jgi:predicted phosphodiesterase
MAQVDGVLAAVADIHGNRWALEAVLADARRRGAGHLLNLGDVAYGPLDPGGTANLLTCLGFPSTTVLGNEDRVLLEPGGGSSPSGTLRYSLESLSAAALQWLGAVPKTAWVGEALLVHGTPDADDEYLLEAVDARGARPRRPEEVGEILSGIDATARLVLCGHSHLARCVQVPGGPLVVNPGSVGLPAYSDDAPFPHVMEAGSPLARYALLEPAGDGWCVALVAVPYDSESAARRAEGNGRPDWARALRTGWAL